MSNQKYNQNLLIGAAVASGIIGTLTRLLGGKKNNMVWSKQARNIANQVFATGEVLNKRMVLGGMVGGLVGAAAALLLAPKSGADLMKDIARPFLHQRERARPIVDRLIANKAAVRKKSASRKSKASTRKTSPKILEKREHRARHVNKKSPSRRRTAATAHKVALHPHHEKSAHEV
jgi:gas vesicle protein